ncbi:LuxR C-terminal-related transcriptional regulator [Pseudomonas putida]|uniref:LuxR C-terminal-related transcriptional regulator n=1 Tax=Pseudomonas putida TaxID=303 RepID=UPI0018D66882|nr:LuxR C-terminal-related transcriptional regulator [Pseudomonas putida]MBH3417584.1 response regulator transcription factor [Pseudomonas putida]MDG9815380.1 LuxR C-terminal-related transcriptional regulator [Pseudomonas putida]
MQNVISFRGMEGNVGILAAQEMKAALGICCGLGNKEIARELDCSPATIKKSIERIFYKLGISSRSAVPTELFYRGIARKLSMIMCVALVVQSAMDDEHLMRIRRGGNGGERKIETRVATRRAECALAVA